MNEKIKAALHNGQYYYVAEPFLYKPLRVANILKISIRGVFKLFEFGKLIAHNDRRNLKGYSVIVDSLRAYRPALFQPILFSEAFNPSNPDAFFRFDHEGTLIIKMTTFSIPHAASLLDISRQEIYRLIDDGNLKSLKIGKMDTLIEYTALLDYVEKFTLPHEFWLDKSLQ